MVLYRSTACGKSLFIHKPHGFLQLAHGHHWSLKTHKKVWSPINHQGSQDTHNIQGTEMQTFQAIERGSSKHLNIALAYTWLFPLITLPFWHCDHWLHCTTFLPMFSLFHYYGYCEKMSIEILTHMKLMIFENNECWSVCFMFHLFY